MKFIELAGWYGVIAILGAYALVSFDILDGSSLWFQLLNLSGAFGIVLETYAKKDYQPFWLNAAWCVIAVVAIVRIFI
jgi:paired small multidrug resistance pump